MSLSDLKNIGEKLAKELESVGIENYDDLASIGSLEAFFKLVGKNGHSCYNKLYALEGAIQGIRWHNLSLEDKEQLKSEYKKYL